MSIPVITELNQALSLPIPPGGINLSLLISNMFVSAKDFPANQHQLISQRFLKARELFQSVWNNGNSNAPFAIFYRIGDRDTLEDQYQSALVTIQDEFKQWMNTLTRKPTNVEVNQFFIGIRHVLLTRNPQTLNEQIKTEVVNHLLIPDKTNLSTNPNNTNIDIWFEAQKGNISSFAQIRFYGVPDVNQAYNVGTIYGPGTQHNWGTNAAWALGVARSGIPIKIISKLDLQHMERNHPNPTELLNPSAFTLEIAIAIKMGYGLEIKNGVVTLRSSSILNNHVTDGQPGNGPLPSKQEELDIFRQCVHARELHTKLSSNNGMDLRNHVYAVCLGVNVVSKSDFIQGLNHLYKGNSALPILGVLTLREHAALREVLMSNVFNTVKYDDLRNIARNIQLTLITADLNSKRLSTSGTDLCNHVHAVCRKGTIIEKQDLMDCLQSMQQSDRSNILNTLSQREKDDLHHSLTDIAFVNNKYDPLKALVKPMAVLNIKSQPVPVQPQTPLKRSDRKRKRGDNHNKESKRQKLNGTIPPQRKDDSLDLNKSSQTTLSNLTSNSAFSQSRVFSPGKEVSLEENRKALEQLQKTKSQKDMEVKKTKQAKPSMTPQMDNEIKQKKEKKQRKIEEKQGRHLSSSHKKNNNKK